MQELMGEQPKIQKVNKPLKRTGSDPRFNDEAYLQKIENQTLAAMEAMLGSGQQEAVQEEVKEEQKESEKKVRRKGSFDLETN